ncbi:hypothetical protein KEM56_002678 [Ascosphaera pollenicola]|nr:hypothetical protein KEM56_002678 [Ascosphaera pollenicola]
MVDVSDGMMKFIVLLCRALVWCSDVIVMGITAYFIAQYETGQHLNYDISISAIGIIFHLPGFVSPFFPSLAWASIPIDIAWSHLYLIGFVFAGDDYNWQSCSVNAPADAACSKKRALEAFLFIGFFFSLVSFILEGFKVHQRKVLDKQPTPNKEVA